MIFILLLGILPLTMATPSIQCTSVVASENKVRIFPTPNAYRGNRITFDATRSEFQGNFIRIQNISSTLEKNFFVTYESDHAIRLMLDNSGIKNSISAGSFLQLFCLEALDLQHNNITVIEMGAFEGLGHLRYLNLSSNYIQSLPVNVFDNMTHLKSLDLSFNEMQTFDCTLRNMGWLTHVNLTQNYLITLDFTHWELPNLHIFDASHNNLNHLEVWTQFRYNQLSRILLGNNLLRKLNIFAIRKMAPNLAQITLEGNPWRCDVLESMIKALVDSRIVYGSYNSTPDHIEGIDCEHHIDQTNSSANDGPVISTTDVPHVTFPVTPVAQVVNVTKLMISNGEVLGAISDLKSIVLFLFAFLVIFMLFEIVVRTGVLERVVQHFRRGDQVLFDNGSIENIRLLPSSNRL